MPKVRPTRPGPGWLLFFTLLSLALLWQSSMLLHGRAQGGVAPQPTPPQQQRPRRAPAPPAQEPATKDTTKEANAGGRPASDKSDSVEVDEDDVLVVDTQLIPVPVVVRDRAGRPVANLRADSFTVFEDGRPQRIANFATSDAPFEIALLLDTSGSTRQDLGLIRRAANLFVEQLRPGDRVAVVSFATVEEDGAKRAGVEVNSPLTNDRERLSAAVEKIGGSNGTPFYDALERVVKDIFREPPREEVRGRRALVALTDGVDSTSDAEFAEARARLKDSGVLTYFIQVNTEEYVEERLLRDCQDDGRLGLSKIQLQRYRRIFAASAEAADFESFCRMGPFERMHISRTLYQLARSEMGQLARDSGGKTFTASDLRDARAAFSQVAEEIGKLYSLGYYSSNKTRDGRFRTIRVEVKGLPGAQVTTREGYQSPKS